MRSVTKNKIGRQDGRWEKNGEMGRKIKKMGDEMRDTKKGEIRRETKKMETQDTRRKKMERQDVSKKKMGR